MGHFDLSRKGARFSDVLYIILKEALNFSLALLYINIS